MNELKKHTKKLLSSTRPDTYTRESAEYVIAAAERCEAAEALCAELRDALKPFSDEEKSWKMQGREDAPIEIGEKGFGSEPAAFSYKDLNRATCVLAKTPAGMRAELAALREDRARLDFMERWLLGLHGDFQEDSGETMSWRANYDDGDGKMLSALNKTIRGAIDAARKEAAK